MAAHHHRVLPSTSKTRAPRAAAPSPGRPSSSQPAALCRRRTSPRCRRSTARRLSRLTLLQPPATHSCLTTGSPTYVASAVTVEASTHSLSHDRGRIRRPYHDCLACPSRVPLRASTRSRTVTSQPSTYNTSPQRYPPPPSTLPPPQPPASCSHHAARDCATLAT